MWRWARQRTCRLSKFGERNWTARTDLFSFGLVLYEMATGQQAFSGETAAVLHEAILNRTPAPARDLNPELPVRLEKIINKALEKDRELRYQSAAQMGADLGSLRRETEPRRSRARGLLAVAGSSLCCLVVGAVLWFTNRQPSSQAGLPELKQRQLTTNSSENAVTERRHFSRRQIPGLCRHGWDSR